MSISLTTRVEAASSATDQLQAEVMKAHRRAMLCHDVQDHAAEAVRIFRDLSKHVEYWQDLLASADTSDRPELIAFEPKWEGLFRKHWENFQKIGQLIRSMEQWKFVIDGKEAFLTAYREMSHVVSLKSETVEQGISQIRAGQSKSLQAVKRELWGAPLD